MTTTNNPFPEIPDAALRQIWQRAVNEFARENQDRDEESWNLMEDTHAEMKARGMEVEGE